MEKISIMTATPWLASACPVAGSHVQAKHVQSKHAQSKHVEAKQAQTKHVEAKHVLVRLRREQAALPTAAYGPFSTVRPMTAATPLTIDDANGVVRGPQPWRPLVTT